MNIAAVEELRDLPDEKNITPAEDRAGAAVERIRAAAGKVTAGPLLGSLPAEDGRDTPAAATPEENAVAFVESLDEGFVEPPEGSDQPSATVPEATTEEPPVADEPDFDARKMGATLRAALLELPRIGEDAVGALERDGILTVHQILARGHHLNKVKGIGDGKARTLLDYAQGVVDEGKKAADETPAPAAEEPAPKAKAEAPAGATFYRGQEYVTGLKAMAEKHKAPWAEVLARAAKALGISAATADDFALRALPDPEWKKIQDWIASATPQELPLSPPAAEAPAVDAEGLHEPAVVELIGDDRVEVLKNTLRTMFEAAGMDDAAKEAWQNEMRAWLKGELGVEVFREVPKARYGDVLAWISDHDARFKK
jgi:hypothetical protein